MPEGGHFRTSPRPQIACMVEITPERGSSAVCYTRDLSCGGLFLEGVTVFEVGQRVGLSLSTPSSWAPLKLAAEICWVAESDDASRGSGLRFVDLTDDHTAALEGFIAALDYEG